MVVMEEIRETYIEVRYRPDRKLVAVLELLSPTNKINFGIGEYLHKRMAILKQPVHLVELDLLVGGHRLPMERPLPPGDYFALIARSEHCPMADVYHWRVRNPLPHIPIPLKSPDRHHRRSCSGFRDHLRTGPGTARRCATGTAPVIPLPATDLEWCARMAAGANSKCMRRASVSNYGGKSEKRFAARRRPWRRRLAIEPYRRRWGSVSVPWWDLRGRWWWGFDLASHFRSQYFWCLIVATAAFVACRQWGLAAASGLLLVVHLCLSWLFYAPVPPTQNVGTPLRIVCLNVHWSNEQHARVSEIYCETSPDVAIIVEVNDEWARVLRTSRMNGRIQMCEPSSAHGDRDFQPASD